MPMRTPEGLPSESDRIMLLAQWVHKLKEERAPGAPKIIEAGMGKPTSPLNPHLSECLSRYWKEHKSSGKAISYDHPQGNKEARTTMAAAMSTWYKTPIRDTDVLFNSGGAAALSVIFASLTDLNSDVPGFRVVTPVPYYTLYAASGLKLHPIDVMKTPGYQLTAESLRKSIEEANRLGMIDGKFARALLFCDPSNPLGTVIGREELLKIARVLEEFPALHIIVDEAYAEMAFSGKHVSLLSVASPELKHRMIVMRSATKALAVAGERIAVTMAFDPAIMAHLVKHNTINTGHAAISLQTAYATTMAHFDETTRQGIVDFYRPKIEYVHTRLKNMGANLPLRTTAPQATFYEIGDFGDLIGEPLDESTERVFGERKRMIASDEHLTYSLLFENGVMAAPLSYFGLPAQKGYLRITCSAEPEELEDLMNRLETRLLQARQTKQLILREKIASLLPVLRGIDEAKYTVMARELETLVPATTCLGLKLQNQTLKNRSLEAQRVIRCATTEGKSQAAAIITAHFRGFFARKHQKQAQAIYELGWSETVKKLSPTSATGKAGRAVEKALRELNPLEREDFLNRLKELKPEAPVAPHIFMHITAEQALPYLGVFLLTVVLFALGISNNLDTVKHGLGLRITSS